MELWFKKLELGIHGGGNSDMRMNIKAKKRENEFVVYSIQKDVLLFYGGGVFIREQGRYIWKIE